MTYPSFEAAQRRVEVLKGSGVWPGIRCRAGWHVQPHLRPGRRQGGTVNSGHSHRGEYAEERHDHDGDYAGKYHRHYDDESTAAGLREDLSRAESRISELEGRLDAAVILLESVVAPKAAEAAAAS